MKYIVSINVKITLTDFLSECCVSCTYLLSHYFFKANIIPKLFALKRKIDKLDENIE